MVSFSLFKQHPRFLARSDTMGVWFSQQLRSSLAQLGWYKADPFICLLQDLTSTLVDSRFPLHRWCVLFCRVISIDRLSNVFMRNWLIIGALSFGIFPEVNPLLPSFTQSNGGDLVVFPPLDILKEATFETSNPSQDDIRWHRCLPIYGFLRLSLPPAKENFTAQSWPGPASTFFTPFPIQSHEFLWTWGEEVYHSSADPSRIFFALWFYFLIMWPFVGRGLVGVQLRCSMGARQLPFFHLRRSKN